MLASEERGWYHSTWYRCTYFLVGGIAATSGWAGRVGLLLALSLLLSYWQLRRRDMAVAVVGSLVCTLPLRLWSGRVDAVRLRDAASGAEAAPGAWLACQ